MLQKHTLCMYMKAYHKLCASVKGTFDRYQRLHKVKHSWGVFFLFLFFLNSSCVHSELLAFYNFSFFSNSSTQNRDILSLFSSLYDDIRMGMQNSLQDGNSVLISYLLHCMLLDLFLRLLYPSIGLRCKYYVRVQCLLVFLFSWRFICICDTLTPPQSITNL
uniref:Uncharacterized protein n=1 Tax=Glossina palpalis gambiensis TaxID=67801 RepID=A0A1B0B0F6_9MUSC